MDPTDSETTPVPQEALDGKVKNIIDFALKQHEIFDGAWGDKPSYHNQYHIQASLDAVDAIFQDVQQNSDSIDPFKLKERLDEWNHTKDHENVRVSDLNMLHHAFRIAFACHDLGNLSDGTPPQEDGTFTHAPYYRGLGSELRSEQIAHQLIEHTLKDDPHKELMKELVQRLIHDTIFVGVVEKEKSPFWQVVQTIDQVGSAYFSALQNEDMVAGLIEEATQQDEINPSERTLPRNATIGGMIGFTNYHMQNAYSPFEQNVIYNLFEKNPHQRTRAHFEFSLELGNPSDQIRYEQHMVPLLTIAQEKANQPSTRGGGIL